MFEIELRDGKKFSCDSNTTIFNAARESGVLLNHSCLKARCRSCIVKVISGVTENIEEELVLSSEERNDRFVLSCNSKPKSDLKLDIEGLLNYKLYAKKILPAKIESLYLITKNYLKLTLRLPPNNSFEFHAGQFINIIKGNITRSYSIANNCVNNNKLDFFIKYYQDGQMSNYLFHDAKISDLLRIEGPIGSFFYRDTNKKELVFIANGTGVAPIKSIIDYIQDNEIIYSKKNIWVFIGVRNEEELFWLPDIKLNDKLKLVLVLSKPNPNWNGEIGYVQHAVTKYNINFSDAQVYASGAPSMIDELKNILIPRLLDESNFYTDYFIQSN